VGDRGVGGKREDAEEPSDVRDDVEGRRETKPRLVATTDGVLWDKGTIFREWTLGVTKPSDERRGIRTIVATGLLSRDET
jgi:hypothetical protein